MFAMPAMLNPLAANPVEHVLPHPLFHVFGVPFNNQMVMALVAALLMLLIFPLFKRPETGAPRGARNFFESILEFLRVEVFRPALKEHTDRFVPFLWTLFFFILFCNLLGQIPLAELMTVASRGTPSHGGGTATGNIATTGALAICAFFLIHVSGITQVFRALRDGTYGHHAHHEEHSSNGTPGHEAAHDLEHIRGEALAADVPGEFPGGRRPDPPLRRRRARQPWAPAGGTSTTPPTAPAMEPGKAAAAGRAAVPVELRPPPVQARPRGQPQSCGCRTC